MPKHSDISWNAREHLYNNTAYKNETRKQYKERSAVQQKEHVDLWLLITIKQIRLTTLCWLLGHFRLKVTCSWFRKQRVWYFQFPRLKR